MLSTLRTIALFVAGFFLLALVLFVVNQTAQVVLLAERVAPWFGTAVLWTLLGLYAVLLVTPLVLYFRLPEALVAPESEDDPRFARHLAALRQRFAANPHLGGHDLADRAGVEAALVTLQAEADARIRRAATAVFTTTAVSQNGRLDSLLVLAVQTRLVWEVAQVYGQRPSLREMVTLYGNVAGTALVASALDDVDVSEHVQAMLASGGLAGAFTAVPGVGKAASLVTNSILDGAANAFLTLRVGVVARHYCGSLVVEPRRALRRSATKEAAGILGGVVKRGTAEIYDALKEGAKESAGRTAEGFRGALSAYAETLRMGGKGMGGV